MQVCQGGDGELPEIISASGHDDLPLACCSLSSVSEAEREMTINHIAVTVFFLSIVQCSLANRSGGGQGGYTLSKKTGAIVGGVIGGIAFIGTRICYSLARASRRTWQISKVDASLSSVLLVLAFGFWAQRQQKKRNCQAANAKLEEGTHGTAHNKRGSSNCLTIA